MPLIRSSILSLWNALQGSARVIRCLQDNREELSYECRATLFDAEVRMAEDIDFKYPMKRACSSELTTMCPGIEHGDARLIRYIAPCLACRGRSGLTFCRGLMMVLHHLPDMPQCH